MNRPTYAEPTLDLFPDEADVELPLDDSEERIDRVVEAGDGAVRNELLGLEDLTTDLRNALAACLSWAEGRSTPNAERVRFWRTLVGRPAVVDEASTPEERRDEGIARAAAKWTDEEAARVDAAIRTVAERARRTPRRPGTEPTLTTADVWQELDGRVPVTKGIAGRMLAAKAAGVIVNTGTTVIAPRESTGPNHGQRLTVWRAL